MELFFEIQKPEKDPLECTSIIIMCIPSMTNKNKRGNSEHPCLNPLTTLNKQEGTLLTKTTKFIEDMQAIIPSMSIIELPILRKTI